MKEDVPKLIKPKLKSAVQVVKVKDEKLLE